MTLSKQIKKDVKLSDIIPYEKNTRKHKTVAKIVRSIQVNGYVTPIIVDENFVILSGHGRYKALLELGFSIVPDVIVIEGLTEEQKEDFRVRDNKSYDEGEWDFKILTDLFDEIKLKDMGFDISRETKEKADEPIPIQFDISKKYDFILVVAENEEDFAYLVEEFELGKVRHPKNKKSIGQSRVVWAKDLIKRIKK